MLVTVTIGGNDAGFEDILAACVLAVCPDPHADGFMLRMAALKEALTSSVYPALEVTYPKARIVHIGYPRLTPAEEEAAVGCAWLDKHDQARAAGIVSVSNDTIRAAAEDSDRAVEYVDVTNALVGHELCTASPWVNPIGLDAGAAHPSAAGQRSIARAVVAALAQGPN